MYLEMTHRQLLGALSANETHHPLFRYAFPPVALRWLSLRCLNSTQVNRGFPGMQVDQAVMDIAQGLMHILRGQFAGMNLC